MQQGIKLKAFDSVKDNRYRIIRFLADGGEGYVYLAQDTFNANQVCVIKQMFQEPFELQGIEDDYQMFSGLFHPNVVQVLDFFWDNNIFYIVMNYVAGQSMKDYLRTLSAPMEELKVLDWILRLAKILDFLHTRPIPIIHADIAPDNIVITPKNDLVIIDFGIARSSFEAVGLREGYSAPEQINGILNISCDVYSLGATMYKCLTLQEQPEAGFDPRNDNPNVSARIAEIVKRATNPKRKALFGLIKGRYENMEEFSEAIMNCYVSAKV